MLKIVIDLNIIILSEHINKTLKVGRRIFGKWPVSSIKTHKHFSKISPE